MTTIANIDINLRARTDQLDSGFTKAGQSSRKFQTELEQVSNNLRLFAPAGAMASESILNFASSIPGIGQAVTLFRELYASAQAMAALDAVRAAASAAKAAAATREAAKVKEVAKAAADSSQAQVIFATAATEAAVSAQTVATAATTTATSLIVASRAMSVLRDQAAGPLRLPGPNMARGPQLALPAPKPDFIDADFTFTPHATKAAAEIGQVANAANAAKLAGAGMSVGMVAGLGAVAAAAGVVVAGFMAVSHAVEQVNVQRKVIDDMSDRAKSLGMTFSELNTLDLSLAETSGLDASAIEASMQKLQVKLAEAAAGDGNARKLFEKMGLDAADLIAAGPLKAMEQLSEATQGMNDAEQLRLSVELFGKSGAMLVNSLREGPEALREMERFAQQIGLALSEAQAEQVGAANDAWNRVNMIATGTWRQIAAEASPVLKVIADEVLGIGVGFSYWHMGLPLMVDSATRLAGTLYDAYEILIGSYKTMYNIATLDFSGVADAFNDAVTFDTGAKWVAQVNAAREAARAAAENAGKNRSTAEGVEAELNAVREAERIASEGRRAEEQLLKERERIAKAEEDARNNKIKSLKDEIAFLNVENTAGLMGMDFDPRVAKELIEAAGQPPAFIEELQRLQDERKTQENLKADLEAARDIRESLKSPLEKIAPQFDRLRDLLDKGRLTNEEAMSAGLQLARDNLPGAAGAAGASTLVQGTAEAYRKTLEMNAQAEHEKAVEQFAEEQLKVQRDMLAQLKNGGGILRITK